MTEQLLAQQLESPSGTGRVEPRSDHQPDSPRQQRTGCQPAQPILTGSYALVRRLPQFEVDVRLVGRANCGEELNRGFTQGHPYTIGIEESSEPVAILCADLAALGFLPRLDEVTTNHSDHRQRECRAFLMA